MVTCLSCKKYIFDSQNVNEFKRMTVEEYIDGVFRKTVRTNDSSIEIAKQIDINPLNRINKSECELCGAPHAIFTDSNKKVTMVRFFFSGLNKPSEKDSQFIKHFRRNFLSQ